MDPGSGLEQAIQSHAEQVAQLHPDLALYLNLATGGQSLPEPVRLGLFHIYQVAMSNVIRHAGANWVEVHLLLDDETVTLSVRDDGRGFQVPGRWSEMARQGHQGLTIAFVQAEAIGGSLEVISNPGKGTLVRAVVPRSLD